MECLAMKQFLLGEGEMIGEYGSYFPVFENVPVSVSAMASVIAFGALANTTDSGAYLDAAIAAVEGGHGSRLRDALGVYRRIIDVHPVAENEAGVSVDG